MINGPPTVTATTGFALLGDPGDDGCAGNSVNGKVTLTGNSGGVEIASSSMAALTVQTSTGKLPYPDDAQPEIEHNQGRGNLACSANTPAPTNDGSPNSVTGTRSGQCATPGF